MEPNYLASFMVALREYVTAEVQAVKADLQGCKIDAEMYRSNASRFDTELVNQLAALDARLRAVESRTAGLFTNVGCFPGGAFPAAAPGCGGGGVTLTVVGDATAAWGVKP